MNFLFFIIGSIYFFLPAYFTNIAASLSRKIKILDFLAKPIDGKKYFRGYPIFGSHKTWRGLMVGLLFGLLISFIQEWLYRYSFIKEISFFDYHKINIFVFGFLISFGAILGDLIFAFFKRRNNIKPGDPWIPFDQINFVIGAFLFLTPYLNLEIRIWIGILVLTFILHILINHLAYFLRLQKTKW